MKEIIKEMDISVTSNPKGIQTHEVHVSRSPAIDGRKKRKYARLLYEFLLRKDVKLIRLSMSNDTEELPPKPGSNWVERRLTGDMSIFLEVFTPPESK